MAETIDHEIVHFVIIKDEKVKETYDKARNPNENPYTVDDYKGEGKILVGETVQFSVLEIVGNMKKAHMEVRSESPVYTIKQSVARDTIEGIIDPIDSSMLILTSESQRDILDCFNQYIKGLTITRMAQITGLSRNTIYRNCRYLIEKGVIVREEDLSYKLTHEDNRPVYLFIVELFK